MPIGSGRQVNGPLIRLRSACRARRARRAQIRDGSPGRDAGSRRIAAQVRRFWELAPFSGACAFAAVGSWTIRWLFAVAASFTLTAAGQSVHADAPWLTVYDDAGRPKWEVRMERLVRTTDGWTGEGVEVQLYHEGAPRLVLRAPRIRADRHGREWILLSDESEAPEVSGEGEGLSFTCQEARWSGGLVLAGLVAEGRGMNLSSTEARWQLGDTVYLVGAEVEFDGWRLTFDVGQYELQHDRLVAGELTATGHGVTLTGTALTAWPDQGRLQVTEAHLVRDP